MPRIWRLAVISLISALYPEDIEGFKKEIDLLAARGERCDIAFLQTMDGDSHPFAAYVMDKLRPKAVFPMNPNHLVMDYKKMAEWLKEKYPGVRSGCVKNPGDAHVYDQESSSLRWAFSISPRIGSIRFFGVDENSRPSPRDEMVSQFLRLSTRYDE